MVRTRLWHTRVLFVVALSLFGAVEPAICQKPSADADFYVAPNGNDNWSGRLDAPNPSRNDGPFATLEHARRAVQSMRKSRRNAPIVVMLRGGTYFLGETLKLNSSDSGSADAPVVYEAYPGEKPVVSGGKLITGWKTGSGRWTATLDPASYQFFEQLFVNDERRYRPRTTKNGYLYNEGPVFVDSQSESCRAFAQGRGQYACFDRFRFKPGDLREAYANITDVEINAFEKWTMSKMRLKTVDTSSGIAYLTGATFQNPQDNGFLRGHRYLVENVKEALSQPGEWYLDRGTSPWQLTYLAKPGETPEKDIVIVPQQPQIIVAENLSYVIFKGLAFEHENWVVPPEGHASLQSEPHVSAALSFRSSHHITLDSCTIAHTGGWGLEFVSGENGPAHHNQVLNSVLYDLGTGGIRVGGYYQRDDTEDNVPHDNLFQNNLITAGGRILPAGIGTGVWIGNSPNNTVTHNEIYDFYGGGIGVCVPTPRGCPFPHDNTISFNHVYQQGQGVTSDFGGIYLATYKTMGNRVINNRVHDVTHNYQDPDGYGGQGIYLDDIASNVLVQNNLVYRTSESTMFNNRGANNTWTNNILAYGRMGIVKRGGLDGGGLRQQQRMRQQRGNPRFGENGPFGGPFGRGQRRQRPGNFPGESEDSGRPPRQQADPDKPVFSFTHNIALFDHGPIQRTPGFWVCAHPMTGESVPCSERFFFDFNLYWNPNRKPATFATSDPENPRRAEQHPFNEWQRLGEDVHSMIEDPRFANPRYPADDFTLLPGSTAEKIGFVPFDPRQSGLTTSLPRPPAQPPAFPLQLLDPATDF
jgi:hypothetical protein